MLSLPRRRQIIPGSTAEKKSFSSRHRTTHISPRRAYTGLYSPSKGGECMAKQDSRTLPPVPPAPQDLDDFIFHWDADVPPVSDR